MKFGSKGYDREYERARRALQNYLKEYDQNDARVRLKIVHTFGVVACSEKIARGLELSAEEVELARIIGLLHDIGRFEQLKRFQSFEPYTMDHAAYGVDILFGEEQRIRDFTDRRDWDSVICEAIARHSDFALKGITDTRTLLHARLIRDADKLDNCRVKLKEPVEVLLGITAREAGAQEITPEIYQNICDEKCILSADRKTRMDYWVSYLGHIFDINYLPTFQIIEEKDYITKIIRRISYQNPRTRIQMEEIQRILKAYVRRKIDLLSGEHGEDGVRQ